MGKLKSAFTNAGKALTKTYDNGDFCIIILTLILVCIGVISVLSASYYSSLQEYGNPYVFFKKQLISACVALLIMFLCTRINYTTYKKFAWPILILAIILLGLLMVPGLGNTVKGATRWFKIPGLSFIMPGECVKPAAIVFVAAYFSSDPKRITQMKSILFVVAILGGIFAMIVWQPNWSTAITLTIIVGAVMYAAGLSWKWLGFLAASGTVLVGYKILTDDGYLKERINSFMDPFQTTSDEGYQVVAGLRGMGSGGLTGVGFGKSFQKTLYLPEPQNDFILAIIGEEMGFIFIAILMIIYLVLIWRLIHISINAPDRFGMLLGSGIAAMVAIQVIFNIAIVTSTMPPTGVALPFISYGGNSLVIFCACMGIMINIGHHSGKERL